MYRNIPDSIDVSSLRDTLRDVLDEVTKFGKRRVVTRHGKPVAAVVPLGDLENLEAREAEATEEIKKAWDKADRKTQPRAVERELSVEEAIDRLGWRREWSSDEDADTKARDLTMAQSTTSSALAALESGSSEYHAQLREIDALDDILQAAGGETTFQTLSEALSRLTKVVRYEILHHDRPLVVVADHLDGEALASALRSKDTNTAAKAGGNS